MKCPSCTTDLTIGERKNIEIDYCPKCRGVWLDRGELDKIIELSSTFEINTLNRESQGSSQRNHRDDDDDDSDKRRPGQGRRKESFLGDLFDF